MASVAPLALRFVLSATDLSQLPDTRGEIAVVGRSNVGKSSLINALANRQGLAKVSKTPGRTQLLNLFALPDGTSVMDLPGYGYASAPASVRARWPAMIEGYLLGRARLRAVVVLVDAEVGPTGNDVATLAWLRAHGLVVRVVATKADKVRSSARARRRTELAEGCGLDPAEVLWVSAAKRVNLDRLRALILEWLDPEPERAHRGGAGDGSVPRSPGAQPAPGAPSPAPAAGPAGPRPEGWRVEWAHDEHEW
jgi:GTP-binding protein